MSLIIERLPEYLSPSSIAKAKNEPNSYYAERLCLDRLPREPQNLAMGVGTAFDIEVKRKLIQKGIPCSIPMEQIESAMQNPSIYDECYEAQGELMRMYRMSKLMTTTKWFEIEGEFHQEYTFPCRGVDKTIPLMLKLDAQCYDPLGVYDMVIPHDWKCSGYSAKSGASPKPGFMDKWDGKKWCGPHKKFSKNMLVTELGMDWARQFTLYGIALNEKHGVPFGTEFPVLVDHPIFNGKFKKPMVARYRAIATPEIQRMFWEEACDLWDDIHDGTFLENLVATEGKFAGSVVASFGGECESFFRSPRKSAHQLWLESQY
jgi:hypothetical protein